MGDKVKWRDAKALRDRIEELEAEVLRLREVLKQSLDSLIFAQEELKAQAHIPAADARILQRRIELVREVLIQASTKKEKSDDQ